MWACVRVCTQGYHTQASTFFRVASARTCAERSRINHHTTHTCNQLDFHCPLSPSRALRRHQTATPTFSPDLLDFLLDRASFLRHVSQVKQTTTKPTTTTTTNTPSSSSLVHAYVYHPRFLYEYHNFKISFSPPGRQCVCVEANCCSTTPPHHQQLGYHTMSHHITS